MAGRAAGLAAPQARGHSRAMDHAVLLDLAVGLARRAAEAILAVRRAGFAIDRKADRSPVTVADRIAEALIVEALREATPSIPVIAEEEVEAGIAPPPPEDPAAPFWLVDPLDGTRDFAAGLDSFTVNIGLVAEGRPLLGIVALPATGELFAGHRGGGAWKEEAPGTSRRPIAVRPIPPEGAVVVASRRHEEDSRIRRFLAEQPRLQRVEALGSAAKICRVAEGTADLYPRYGRTMEWDTAAPQAVLEAAGGSLRGWDGRPLGYRKPGWANPGGFLCRGLPEVGSPA
jgi:3'(2'), 5'-bisphosphate nucleotidase